MYESVAKLCNGWNSSRTEQHLRKHHSLLFFPPLSLLLFSPLFSSSLLFSSLLSSSFLTLLFFSLLFSSFIFSCLRPPPSTSIGSSSSIENPLSTVNWSYVNQHCSYNSYSSTNSPSLHCNSCCSCMCWASGRSH
jgi:hypothetical protein